MSKREEKRWWYGGLNATAGDEKTSSSSWTWPFVSKAWLHEAGTGICLFVVAVMPADAIAGPQCSAPNGNVGVVSRRVAAVSYRNSLSGLVDHAISTE